MINLPNKSILYITQYYRLECLNKKGWKATISGGIAVRVQYILGVGVLGTYAFLLTLNGRFC